MKSWVRLGTPGALQLAWVRPECVQAVTRWGDGSQIILTSGFTMTVDDLTPEAVLKVFIEADSS